MALKRGGMVFLVVIAILAVVIALLFAPQRRGGRIFHALMYLVLLFGLVHADSIGADFQNFGVRVIFFALFSASLAGFAFKNTDATSSKEKCNDNCTFNASQFC
jgi:predicted ferric reductase